MALRVWLPLNGSVENKGISDTTMSGSPASWGNGKIGKCATFTGNVGNVIYNNTTDYNYTDKFSWAVWINTNFTGTTSQFAFTNGRADAGGYGYGLQCTNTTTCNIRFGNQSYGVAVTGGEWTHLTFTKNGTSIKIYKNGSIVTDTTFTGTLPTYSDGNGLGLGCFHYSGNIYPFYGSLNDFRIYDHCLSPKEVKEISQGLVLHYKLDGWSGGINENLALDTANKINTSTAATKTVTLDYGLQSNFSLIRGNKITISADIILENAVSTATSGSKRVGFEPAIRYSDNTLQYMGYWIGLDSTPKTSSGRYSTTVTVQNKDFQSIAQNGTYIQGLTSGTATIKNIKVELGDKATPWSPAPQDLGIDTTKVIDSSGYEHDGTIVGALTTDTNTLRYDLSAKQAASDLIEAPYNPIGSNSFTISGWFYRTGGACTYYAAKNVYETYICLENGRYFIYNSSGSAYVGNWTSAQNTWQYIVLVNDASNKKLKLYVNGTFISEVTTDGTVYNSDILNIGGRQGTGSYVGLISDFRIYATALSAEDIIDLYHASANIDNEKRLHSFEFVEDDDNRVDKQGLVHSGLLSSDSDLIKLLYDKELHIEPDGSVWAHIYHHNRPDLGSFSSTNDFANSVKIDDNRWFNATEIVNSFSSEWEFLIIYNFTQGGTVYKERWIQTKNPETAVFGDVDAADITRVTGNGYRTGTWGGLYKKNSSAYWVMNNGTNGNWWGATGSFSIYQGGIPGYGGSITTTGCNDLYIRIDRFSSTPTHASIGRGSVYTFDDFIEK